MGASPCVFSERIGVSTTTGGAFPNCPLPGAFVFGLAIALFAAAAKQIPAPPVSPATSLLPSGTKAFCELAYVTGGHERQKLDLFVPGQPGEPRPLLIWIHGGGWRQGDKANCPPLRLGYTREGYAVASINYRLSGDAIFPAQIEDCKAAIRWLRARAKPYRLDSKRFGVWGRSAGGHLVALIGTSGGVPEFDVGADPDVSSRVQAVCDFSGPTDLLQIEARAAPESLLRRDPPSSNEWRFIGGPIQDPKNRARVIQASPVTHVSTDDPPFLIVHGDKDGAVPYRQSELLYAALKRAGIPVHFHTIKGMVHGFVAAGQGLNFSGPEIPALARTFFDHHLLGKPTAAARWPAAMTSASEVQPDSVPPNP